MSDQKEGFVPPVYKPANATDLKATYYDGKVTVTATVEKLTSCARFALQVEPFLIFPRRYRIVTFEQKKPEERCAQLATMVPFAGELPFQTPPTFLNIHTSDGVHHVPVAIGEAPAPTDTPLSENIPTTTAPRTATGYSNTFDLVEAINDALKKIPASPGVDILDHFQVETIGVEIGGIAGLHRMYVVITG